MKRPALHSLVMGLAALLSVQLTGLTCLADQASASFAPAAYQHNVHLVEDEFGQAEASDGCPCHLHFVSIDSPLLLPGFLIVFVRSSMPIDPLSALEYPQFRLPALI